MTKYLNKVVLGTVQFGCQYGINSEGRPSEDMVSDILQEAYKVGIQKLDTSCAYGNSEEIIGKCISTGEPFFIISKYPKGKQTVQESFSSSLSRLEISKLYGYLLHHFELYKQNHAVWDDFVQLKEEGKVKKIGFSLYDPKELKVLLANAVNFDLLQIPYNLFDRKFEPYFKVLSEKGVEIHVRSTFLQGLFFKDRETLPEKLKPLRKYLLKLDEYSKTHGLTISELALNFNVQNPYIDGVLIGVDNVEQLRQNIRSLSDKKIDLNINVKEQELLNPVNWK